MSPKDNAHSKVEVRSLQHDDVHADASLFDTAVPLLLSIFKQTAQKDAANEKVLRAKLATWTIGELLRGQKLPDWDHQGVVLNLYLHEALDGQVHHVEQQEYFARKLARKLSVPLARTDYGKDDLPTGAHPVYHWQQSAESHGAKEQRRRALKSIVLFQPNFEVPDDYMLFSTGMMFVGRDRTFASKPTFRLGSHYNEKLADDFNGRVGLRYQPYSAPAGTQTLLEAVQSLTILVLLVLDASSLKLNALWSAIPLTIGVVFVILAAAGRYLHTPARFALAAGRPFLIAAAAVHLAKGLVSAVQVTKSLAEAVTVRWAALLLGYLLICVPPCWCQVDALIPEIRDELVYWWLALGTFTRDIPASMRPKTRTLTPVAEEATRASRAQPVPSTLHRPKSSVPPPTDQPIINAKRPTTAAQLHPSTSPTPREEREGEPIHRRGLAQAKAVPNKDVQLQALDVSRTQGPPDGGLPGGNAEGPTLPVE
ncbi:hypothetical protein B0A55_13301 [Friedmanniomyces simplex]|uniref:Uncharacterized protein n=1 Tax=Friedmanniomyces simplex TaxID=329884 RepID=A0A4U0VLN7_9PEZI|nr:hypothetical protein B0A55_13301 [Friedmanniomyces simplex]